MSENTLIRGWSIKQGDYLRDPEYDDEFIKTKKRKVVFQQTVFSFGAVLAIASFFGIMTFLTFLMK